MTRATLPLTGGLAIRTACLRARACRVFGSQAVPASTRARPESAATTRFRARARLPTALMAVGDAIGDADRPALAAEGMEMADGMEVVDGAALWSRESQGRLRKVKACDKEETLTTKLLTNNVGGWVDGSVGG